GERHLRVTHRALELVPHHLDHLLGRREALHDLLGQRAVTDSGQQVVGDLGGDVGLQQRHAHLGEGTVHLLGVELAAGTQLLEDAVETAGEGVEHRGPGYDPAGEVSGGPSRTRSTVRSSSVGGKGLVKYSSAPSERTNSRPSSPVAVMMITRMSRVASWPLSSASTSAPLVPGMLRSRNMMSGGRSRTIDNAVLSSEPSGVSNPAFSRISRIASRIVGRSSTIRISARGQSQPPSRAAPNPP